jgi:hypothetical protein
MDRIFQRQFERTEDVVARPSATASPGPAEVLSLQRTAGNAAVARILQRYTEAAAAGSLPARRISASGEYIVAVNNPGILWRRSGSTRPPPLRCTATGNVRGFWGVQYDAWTPMEHMRYAQVGTPRGYNNPVTIVIEPR